ncbi:MAG: efflux RND transporter permease subunit [Pseudodesulfovibrio sp.]
MASNNASGGKGYPEGKRSLSRPFVMHRSIAWALMIFVLCWGWFGYDHMPKRKDPSIPVRQALVVCSWPGMDARKVEELVTRRLEQAIAGNSAVHEHTEGNYGIRSMSLAGVSVVTIRLSENIDDTTTEFSDIHLSLLEVDLPQGAGPVQFFSGFGETAALMLTVASPRQSEVTASLLAQPVSQALSDLRKQESLDGQERQACVLLPPEFVSSEIVERVSRKLTASLDEHGHVSDLRSTQGDGFLILDMATNMESEALRTRALDVLANSFDMQRFDSVPWRAMTVREPSEVRQAMVTTRGDKYSPRDLDHFTDLLQRALFAVPEVSKVKSYGVQNEVIYLEYSQVEIAARGLVPAQVLGAIQAQNVPMAGGVIDLGKSGILIEPQGNFRDAKAIGDVIIGTDGQNAPIYLRDIVSITHGYQNPATYLNYYNRFNKDGEWQRRGAVTLAVQMRDGEQIGKFAENVEAMLNQVSQVLPADLIVKRTSNQPEQVKENIDLFMEALYEAIVLVILVALIGFWEWRTALLMAVSIPVTLAMTFGVMDVIGIDIQQVSVATLIIALGLLVDDPVVASDAIRRNLDKGVPRKIAAWLGPDQLSRPIIFATITNVVAYLPFLLLSGNTGEFLYSLPLVMTCALISSRIVAMTFVPLLGYTLQRPCAKSAPNPDAPSGFAGFYARTVKMAMRHRWPALGVASLVLVLGVFFGSRLSTAFFPLDVQHLSYVDIWLPTPATLASTNQVSAQAEGIIKRVCGEYAREQSDDKDADASTILKSVTVFVGGGGPRFWFSVSPEQAQLNYAQLVVEVYDKDFTPELIPLLQYALSAELPGVIADVNQLQINPVETPVAVHIYGRAGSGPTQIDGASEKADIETILGIADQVQAVLSAAPEAGYVRSNWGSQSLVAKLDIDAAEANLAGLTVKDVARSVGIGLSGSSVTNLRLGDKEIPVVARLLPEERSGLESIDNLYVYAGQGQQKIPLSAVASTSLEMRPEKIMRRDHFRCITVWCNPVPGGLASRVMKQAMPGLEEIMSKLPAGYEIQLGGERAKQKTGFSELAIVLVISVIAIYFALVLQFMSLIKPLVVFAAAPFGVVGSLAALWIMGTPFGFMAFLGIASLIGVIVSHIIVLFDFVEEMRAKGEPLEKALTDAGVLRLRPVLITVLATVLALIPLTIHGGPLWQPLCYAQIGGLLVATFVTLLLVPVLYTIFVHDLKIIKWEADETGGE